MYTRFGFPYHLQDWYIEMYVANYDINRQKFKKIKLCSESRSEKAMYYIQWYIMAVQYNQIESWKDQELSYIVITNGLQDHVLNQNNINTKV